MVYIFVNSDHFGYPMMSSNMAAVGTKLNGGFDDAKEVFFGLPSWWVNSVQYWIILVITSSISLDNKIDISDHIAVQYWIILDITPYVQTT